MNAVAGGAVQHGVVRHVLAVVDEDGPEVHKDEQGDVGQLLQREHEGEDVVGEALREAVERVEGVAREGSGHDPLVVRLVEVLVDAREMQPAVDPVDAEVGEEDEEWELRPVIPLPWAIFCQVVEFAVTPDFG